MSLNIEFFDSLRLAWIQYARYAEGEREIFHSLQLNERPKLYKVEALNGRSRLLRQKIGVPVKVELHKGRYWYDCNEKLFFPVRILTPDRNFYFLTIKPDLDDNAILLRLTHV